MKTTFISFIIAFGIIIQSLSNGFALTNIPSTESGREARIEEIERQLKTQSNKQLWKELAMIYSAHVGMGHITEKSVNNILKLFKKATKLLPKDYELMAAHGSVLMMKAQFGKSTSRKMMYVKRGARKMDRAIKKDPNNIGARIQRGNNSLGLPLFLNRLHFAKKDFEKILSLDIKKFGNDFKAMILFNLGCYYQLKKEIDMANEYWKKAQNLNSSYWSKKAEAKIN